MATVNEDTTTQPTLDDSDRAAGLLKRCRILLSELEAFRTFLTERRKEHAVEIRPFYSSILSELKSLEKVHSS